MALEFNADKERIASSNLQIKKMILPQKLTIGGAADEKDCNFRQAN